MERHFKLQVFRHPSMFWKPRHQQQKTHRNNHFIQFAEFPEFAEFAEFGNFAEFVKFAKFAECCEL